MTLDGRVWQFMFGFLAHFVYQSKLFDWTSKNNESSCYKMSKHLFNLIPTSLLILLVTLPVINIADYQLQRFLVVFLTALIISTHQNDSFLSNKLLVKLGDVSYSVYLVHWPIFTMHRYLDPSSYENEKEAGLIVGSCLIGVSVLLGYLIENRFKQLLISVKNWSHLFKLLFILYLTAGICLALLHKDGVALNEISRTDPAINNLRIRDAVMLLKTRGDGRSFSQKEIIKLNTEMEYANGDL
ncbi:Acyl-transf-3 domain-containing protein [Aphelenchoides bicaudatus]|nr:Acyl-transf-3 domain-containing protein [Aphelenchoides bicaudatus]